MRPHIPTLAAAEARACTGAGPARLRYEEMAEALRRQARDRGLIDVDAVRGVGDEHAATARRPPSLLVVQYLPFGEPARRGDRVRVLEGGLRRGDEWDEDNQFHGRRSAAGSAGGRDGGAGAGGRGATTAVARPAADASASRAPSRAPGRPATA